MAKPLNSDHAQRAWISMLKKNSSHKIKPCVAVEKDIEQANGISAY